MSLQREKESYLDDELAFTLDSNQENAVIEVESFNEEDPFGSQGEIEELDVFLPTYNDDIQVGEVASSYDPQPTNRVKDFTKKKVDIEQILEQTKLNHQNYINGFMGFEDFEEFLSILPDEYVASIRKHTQKNHIYGNQPLEQMFMMQFGVILQTHDLNVIEDNMIARLAESLHKFRYTLVKDIEDAHKLQFKEWDRREKTLVRTIKDATTKFKEAAEIRKEQLDNEHEIQMDGYREDVKLLREAIEADKEKLLLELRNDLIGEIKKDVNGWRKDIRDEAKKSFAEFADARRASDIFKSFCWGCVQVVGVAVILFVMLKMSGAIR